MGVVENLLSAIFVWIDKFIALLISEVYNLILWLAESTLFSKSIIETLGERIYSFIGIFMLFKFSFSLIQYIADPEKANSGETSGAKLVSKILLSLALLIGVRYIFQAAYGLQGIILKQDVIGKVVFGVSDEVDEDGNSKSNNTMNGENFAFNFYSALIYPNPYVVGDDACAGVYASSTVLSNCITKMSASSLKIDTDVIEIFTTAIRTKDAQVLLDFDLVTELAVPKAKGGSDEDTNAFKYTPIFTTAVGIIVLLLLINTCIDVAVRSIKLGFMQLIAPIPILSNAVPGSKGKDIFNKWVSNCISTFTGLFIKLIALDFVIFIIGRINFNTIYIASTVYDETPQLATSNPFGWALFIIGALMFANQVPQLISDITGVKMDGDFSLNPMKKIGQSTFASALVGGAAGFGLGTISNARNAYLNNKKYKEKMNALMAKDPNLTKKDARSKLKADGVTRKGLGSVMAGGFSGGFRSGWTGLSGQKKSISEIGKAGLDHAVTHRNLRASNKKQDIHFPRTVMDRADRYLGVNNEYGGQGALSDVIKQKENQLSAAADEERYFRESLTKMKVEAKNAKNDPFKDVAFNTAFVRGGKDGMGDLAFVTDPDGDLYDQYKKYMAAAGISGDDSVLDKKAFEQFYALEEKVHNANMRTEALKKEISSAKKAIPDSK